MTPTIEINPDWNRLLLQHGWRELPTAKWEDPVTHESFTLATAFAVQQDRLARTPPGKIVLTPALFHGVKKIVLSPNWFGTEFWGIRRSLLAEPAVRLNPLTFQVISEDIYERLASAPTTETFQKTEWLLEQENDLLRVFRCATTKRLAYFNDGFIRHLQITELSRLQSGYFAHPLGHTILGEVQSMTTGLGT